MLNPIWHHTSSPIHELINARTVFYTNKLTMVVSLGKFHSIHRSVRSIVTRNSSTVPIDCNILPFLKCWSIKNTAAVVWFCIYTTLSRLPVSGKCCSLVYWARGRTTYSNRGLPGSFVVETNYLSATFPSVTPYEYSKQIIQAHYHKLQHPITFTTRINYRMLMTGLPLNFER